MRSYVVMPAQRAATNRSAELKARASCRGQTLNGQNAMCVSLLSVELDMVAGLLRTADLDIYSPKTFTSGVLEMYVLRLVNLT